VACGFASHGTVYGTGYQQVSAALDNRAALSAFFMPLKLISTAACSISGIPGGIFSPSPSIGAGIGADLSQLFTASNQNMLILVGMVAFLAAVHAPITAFIIVMEMTNDHAMLIPLMAAALMGSRHITAHLPRRRVSRACEKLSSRIIPLELRGVSHDLPRLRDLRPLSISAI
jgi:H+/Cl- antiporter ClcA